MILVDTSVLSAALRYRKPSPTSTRDVEILREMILAGVAPSVPGIVVQEILSGVKAEAQFVKLKNGLQSFPVVLAQATDHFLAASLFNTCRKRGIAATLVDCLIAAQTVGNNAKLWTLDRDFLQITRCSDLVLFAPDNPGEKP